MASIKKRGNYYHIVVEIGIDPRTGERRQRTKGGFKSKPEAKQAAPEFEKEVRAQLDVDNKDEVFKDLASRWMEEYQRQKKQSTVDIRKKELKKIMNFFAYLKVKDISKKRYQNMLNVLDGEGYSRSYISGIHGCARMIFKKAMEDDVILRNPTEFAKIPDKVKTVEEIENENTIMKFMEKEELAAFLKTAYQHGKENDFVIFLTLAYSGMRTGELLALKWKDIDFEQSKISITKTLYNPNNNYKKYSLQIPKTKRSIREIKMDKDVMGELKKHRVKQNEFKLAVKGEYLHEDFVFARVDGFPLYVKLVQRRMQALLELSDLTDKQFTPHSLRHTHTSLLIEAEVDLKAIMERLGHGDYQIMMNVYAHMTKRLEEKASSKFSDLMQDIMN